MNTYERAVTASSDTAGKAVFRWPSVTQGQWIYVSCTVPTAPPTAAFTLKRTGQPQFSWLGSMPSAAKVFPAGCQVTVEATTLGKTADYTALLVGGWTTGHPQGVPPAGPSSFTRATNVTINNYLPATASGILTVRRTLTGLTTPVQADTDFPFHIGMTVHNEQPNAGPIYIGGGPTSGAPVSINSYRLTPGEAQTFAIANANIIWVIGTTGVVVGFFGE